MSNCLDNRTQAVCVCVCPKDGPVCVKLVMEFNWLEKYRNIIIVKIKIKEAENRDESERNKSLKIYYVP